MIHMTDKTRYPIEIDAILRANIPTFEGISTGGYGTIVHLTDEATQSDQDNVNTIIANFDTLTLVNQTIAEGDPDPEIVFGDALIASDIEMGFYVTKDGTEYDNGTTPVVAGEVTLTLVSPIPGIYTVYLYRLEGNFASGIATITVTEAS